MATEGTAAPAVTAGSLLWAEARRPEPPASFDWGALGASLTAAATAKLRPGAQVGVAVGSRGIADIARVVASVVEAVKRVGAIPIVVPAMGSHGGATGQGQISVLRELGVTPGSVGAPIEASMAVRALGQVEGGHTVYMSEVALACDAVIPVNRVKPHTDFRADVESGLTKMLTIGLGKQAGASSIHQAGFGAFGTVLPGALEIVLCALDVPFGVALIEDSWHRLHHGQVVIGSYLEHDALLLQQARAIFGGLPFAEAEVLVLKELGKTVSGAGMDPNVTGRFPYEQLPSRTHVSRLVVLDVRDDSEGNATGVGVADVVTERLRAKIDWAYTYANATASKSLAGARLPLVASNDEEAISVALASLVGDSGAPVRAAYLANTLDVNHLMVTPPLVQLVEAAGYVVDEARSPALFGSDGRLQSIGKVEVFG